jgi:hypothetical protein
VLQDLFAFGLKLPVKQRLLQQITFGKSRCSFERHNHKREVSLANATQKGERYLHKVLHSKPPVAVSHRISAWLKLPAQPNFLRLSTATMESGPEHPLDRAALTPTNLKSLSTRSTILHNAKTVHSDLYGHRIQ